MEFVNGNRCLERRFRRPLLHPVLISPFVVQIPNDRRGARWLLVEKAKRISFVADVSMMLRSDVKFIERALGDPGHKSFPNAGLPAGMQRMRAMVPLIEASDHRYFPCIRCPHTEAGALLPASGDDVRTELVIDPIVTALVEEVQVLVSQKADIFARREYVNGFFCHFSRKPEGVSSRVALEAARDLTNISRRHRRSRDNTWARKLPLRRKVLRRLKSAHDDKAATHPKCTGKGAFLRCVTTTRRYLLGTRSSRVCAC